MAFLIPMLETARSSLKEPIRLTAAIDETAAAELISMSVHTLRKWRSERRGPPFVKIAGAERPGRGRAGRVLYREADLLWWLDEMTLPAVDQNRVLGMEAQRV